MSIRPIHGRDRLGFQAIIAKHGNYHLPLRFLLFYATLTDACWNLMVELGLQKTAAHPDFEVRTLTFLLWKTLRLAVTHLISPQPAPQLCGSSPH